MVILTALTGQIGKPGAALGHPGGGQGYGAALAAWPLPEDMVPADIPVRADRFADTDAGVHVIISLATTLQQYYANMNKTREWLPKLDFILHVGMYDEDSAAFCRCGAAGMLEVRGHGGAQHCARRLQPYSAVAEMH